MLDYSLTKIFELKNDTFVSTGLPDHIIELIIKKQKEIDTAKEGIIGKIKLFLKEHFLKWGKDGRIEFLHQMVNTTDYFYFKIGVIYKGYCTIYLFRFEGIKTGREFNDLSAEDQLKNIFQPSIFQAMEFVKAMPFKTKNRQLMNIYYRDLEWYTMFKERKCGVINILYNDSY